MNTNIPADIATKFQAKYDWLKQERFSTLGGAIEPGIYKTPDGGWQCNYDGAWGYGCAITLLPGSHEPHEVHGQICKRWYQEGGAFDENGKRGWLGYPTSDEERYDGDGDSEDRISHFENGDIIWTAKTKETRIIKKGINEMKALNSKRQEIITPLEGLRSFVKRPINGLTDSRIKEIEEDIDSTERSICYDRYRVTVLGAFSSGKSTLLNALMGADYLPSADLPTTNITTEIFRSDGFYVFMPDRDIKKASLKSLRDEVAKEIPSGVFLESLERDGQLISGVGIGFRSDNSKEFRQVIAQLASEPNRHETGFPKFKQRLKDGQGIVLQIGIPNLPEWLGEITLTDAPGAGSVHKGHETIIDDIIPRTQLVLYVVESPKAGSSVDKMLFNRIVNRIVNSCRRKVFFILNKIDQQNNDEIEDALAELKEEIPSVKAGNDAEPTPPKPEFLKSSALFEVIANRLSDGSLMVNDLASINKLPLKLAFSDEWTAAKSDDDRKNAAIRFLRKESQFDKLRERIKFYLHEENKDLPFCERAEGRVKAFGQELDAVCKATIVTLRTDKSDKELEEKRRELHQRRERSATEARNALKDFQESALRPKTGVMSKVNANLESIPNAVVEKLEKILADNNEFKKLTKNKCKELRNWLTREVSDQMDPIARSLDGELRRQGDHLIERLRPILKQIDDDTIANQYNNASKDIQGAIAKQTGINENADDTILATSVSAGVFGGATVAILGLTVGSTSVAATGLAGLAGAAGLGSFASTLAGLGLGSEALTVTFFGLGLGPIVAIVGLVVAAAAFSGNVLARKFVRKQIVKKVGSELEKLIVGEDASSVIKKTKANVETIVNGLAKKCRTDLDDYLENLDKQEKKILADVAKAKDDKEKTIETLETFRKEVKVFVESSVQSLRELNPGKEPVYG